MSQLCGGHIERDDVRLPQLTDHVVVFRPKGASPWVQVERPTEPKPKRGCTGYLVRVMAPVTVKGGDGCVSRRGV
jgi:hypothetical protein